MAYPSAGVAIGIVSSSGVGGVAPSIGTVVAYECNGVTGSNADSLCWTNDLTYSSPVEAVEVVAVTSPGLGRIRTVSPSAVGAATVHPGRLATASADRLTTRC